MTLKELTLAKHRQAESTKFMQAIFNKTLTLDLWMDFTVQKAVIYNTIETVGQSLGVFKNLTDLPRAYLLEQDYREHFLLQESTIPEVKQTTLDYQRYILSLYPDSEKITAHIYTWHMGDLYGGQMIKDLIPGPNLALNFHNRDQLITNLRNQLSVGLANEANIAFDWAIRILKEYDNDI